MKAALIVLCAFLAACGGAPKLPERVLVPVVTPCLSAPIPAPTFVSDGELAKLPDYDFVITLARDRLERRQYIGILEAALAGCS